MGDTVRARPASFPQPMTQTHGFDHPYLRYAGGSSEPREDLHGRYVRVVSVRSGQTLRLLPEEHALASLFDGQRTAAQRLAAAQSLQPEILAADMDALAAELSEHELLLAGSEEPLPVPAQTEAERQQAFRQREGGHEADFPPLSEPGSLGGQSSLGPLAGSIWRGRVEAERIDWPFHPGAWAWLGRLFAWPVSTAWGPWLVVAISAVLLYALWGDQDMAAADVQRLLAWQNLLAVGLPSAVLTNLITQLARAWAIHKETGSWPRFGIVFALGCIPRVLSDTEGAAEHVERRARMRIVAAPLVAGFMLFITALLGWFVLRQATTMLPAVLITAALMGLANALLRLNPLARTDGYYLLAQWLGIADLREQSFLGLLGIKLRWGNRTPPPRGPLLLYAVLVMAFLAAVVALIILFPARWLEGHFGGSAVAVLLGISGFYLLTLAQRYRDRRSQLGRAPWQPGIDSGRVAVKRYGPRFALVALVALWPYTYEPGGRVHLQPLERAEVATAVAGRVVAVTVAEGDWVEAGELLARLDGAEVDARIEGAQAEVARLQAALERARNGATAEEIALAEQRVATAEARLRHSDSEAQRAEAALGRRAVTTQERDAAVSRADVDRETLALEQANLSLVRSPTREEDIRALESELAAQQANLVFFETEQAQTELRAPVSGYVVGADLRYLLGRYLDEGEVIGSVENTRELTAQLLLPEFAAQEARVGMSARVKVWSRPGESFTARVSEVAPVAEVGENGRILRLRLQLDNAGAGLHSEMSGQAKIVAGRVPLIVAYGRAALRFALVEVWSWLP